MTGTESITAALGGWEFGVRGRRRRPGLLRRAPWWPRVGLADKRRSGVSLDPITWHIIRAVPEDNMNLGFHQARAARVVAACAVGVAALDVGDAQAPAPPSCRTYSAQEVRTLSGA